MNISITEKQLKRNAKALRAAHPDWSQQQALDQAAVNAEFQSYAHFKHIEPWLSRYVSIDEVGTLKGIERAYETMLPIRNGYMVFPRDPVSCHTVRFVDGELIEHFMWDSQEWQEDPASVMGAILGLFMRGLDEQAIAVSNYDLTGKGVIPYQHELRHIDDLYAIRIAKGHGWIAFDAFPEEIRFYDETGRTLLKTWHADELSDNPLSVMGDILHTIKREIAA